MLAELRAADPDSRGIPRTIKLSATDYLSVSRRLDAGGDGVDFVLQKPMAEVWICMSPPASACIRSTA
jgi:hypothetical protein